MSKLDAFSEIVQTNAPTSALTWLRLGGPIEYLAEPRDEEELVGVLKACREDGVRARVLGDGSNLLVSDVGAPGLAIRLTAPAFCEIQLDAPFVVAGGGAKVGRLATATATAGLAGLEGLIGIPGTVGAGVALNASTNDASFEEYVESVRVAYFNGEIAELSKSDIVFGDGVSSLENAIVLSAKFCLTPENPEELAKRLQKIWIVRKQTTPDATEGCARMFKNPRGQRAADLIADAGFRGARIGGAVVCERNPNFVEASEGCASEDVKRLLNLIQTQARERLGVELERELEIW